jgi:hypothetical protein
MMPHKAEYLLAEIRQLVTRAVAQAANLANASGAVPPPAFTFTATNFQIR